MLALQHLFLHLEQRLELLLKRFCLALFFLGLRRLLLQGVVHLAVFHELRVQQQRQRPQRRLLQAAVDTLAADRFTRAVTWVNAGDDALRTFLTDAGWAADTAHRELDLDGTGTTTVKQVRLHTAIG